MKIHYYIFISIASFLLPLSEVDNKISNSLNDFGIQLLRQIDSTKRNDNVLFSPYSISFALLMASEGSLGSTKKEILDILGLYEIDSESLHNFIFKYLEQKNENISLINGTWIQRDECYSPNKDFIRVMNSIYNSKISYVDFSELKDSIILDINNWVSEQTNSLILDMISDEDIRLSTVQVIINALYFYEEWNEAFNPSQTVENMFYSNFKDSVNVKMLTNTSYYSHFKNDLLHVLEIPYKDKETSFLVLLPNKNNIDDILNHLDIGTLQRYIENSEYEKGNIKIPQFTLQSSYSLKNHLINMGIISPFNPRSADFSGFWDYDNYCQKNPPKHYIDIIKHKSAFKIDEIGTEATSATSVIINRVTMVDPMEQSFSFIANKPFIYMIYNKKQNAILFTGIYKNPN